MSYRKVRPIYESARMAPGTLARFLDGLNWAEIRAVDRSVSMGWWRGAVFNGEQDGLLVWLGGRWWLTDAGKAAVREVA